VPSSLVLLKPDAVRHRIVGVLVSSLEWQADIVKMKMDRPTRFFMQQHYKDHVGKDFFDGLIDFMVSGPLVAIQVDGEIMDIRAWVHRVREQFPCQGPANVVHASDSVESGERECKLWFP
jgi:nucleoside-diphosphate kinase